MAVRLAMFTQNVNFFICCSKGIVEHTICVRPLYTYAYTTSLNSLSLFLIHAQAHTQIKSFIQSRCVLYLIPSITGVTDNYLDLLEIS